MKYINIVLASMFTGFTLSFATAQSVDMTQRAEELKNLHWGMFIC